jgi:PAS domain S-box-containing protein
MHDPSGAQPKARILICEDEVMLAKELTRSLKNLGYEVVGRVTSAEDAFGIIEEFRPDLILMDITLDGKIDGIEAAEQILSRFDIPVVYLTGYAEKDVLDRAKKTEPYGYLSKPVGLLELRSTIETALYKHEADQRVRESEEKFRKTFEHSGVGMAIVGLDGTFLTVNGSVSRILGYSEKELLELNFTDITHSEDLEESIAKHKRLLSGKEGHYETEKRYVHKDGQTLWGRLNVSLVRDRAGNPMYSVAQLNDITLRKQSEEAFRDQLSLMESLIEAVPAPVFFKNTEHVYVGCNEAFAEFIGRPREQIIGKSVFDVAPRELAELYRTQDDKLFDNPGSQVYEASVQRADGTMQEVVFQKATYSDSSGALAGLIGVMLDITERKNSQKAQQKAISETNALLAISRLLLEKQGFQETSRRIFDSAKKVTGATAGYVALMSSDGSENEVLFLDSGDLPCTVDSNLPMPIRGLRERAYRTGKTVYDNDFNNSEWMRFMPEGHAVLENVMFAPLVIEGKAAGVIGLANKQGGFSQDDARLATGLAEFAAIGLQNNFTEEKIVQQNNFLNTVLESLKHPFYVVDSNDYTIKIANSATRLGDLKEDSTCYALTHRRSDPCNTSEHPCPLAEVKQTGKPLTVEHVHFDKEGNHRHVEVHAYPVFDKEGKVEQIVEYLLDITERKKAEDQIQATLKEKEVLLREIHHRVKNNLALISSLLGSQSEYTQDEFHKKMFEDTQARVRSMALAHQLLYQSESLANLRGAEYIGHLVDHLVVTTGAMGKAINVEKEMEDLSFSLDTAIPVGFLMTELVSNCLKHAFPDRNQGEIKISLKSLGDDQFELMVKDNGVGMPEDVDLKNPKSLGLDLVDTFAEQLKGRIDIRRDEGTEFRIMFTEKGNPK